MKSEIHKILETNAYFELGIAPIIKASEDFNRILASLPPEESRKMKRKFRKLWRKAVKNPRAHVSSFYLSTLGLGCQDPSKAQKNTRKAEVKALVNVRVIRPMLAKVSS